MKFRDFGWGIVSIAVLAAPVLAQKTVGDWHIDKENGFKVRTLTKWKQIPLQPNEQYEITKFEGPEIEIIFGQGHTARSSATLRILRFVPKVVDVTTGAPTKPPETPPAPKKKDSKDDEDDDDFLAKFREKNRSASFEDWLKNPMEVQSVNDHKTKAVKYGKTAGIEHTFLTKGNLTNWSNFAVTFPLDGIEISLCYSVPESQYEKWEEAFRASVKTFTALERDKTTQVTPPSMKKNSELTLEEQRKRHQTDVSKVEGWELAETKNYFIKIHNPDKEFIEQIKEHIELIRAKLEADFPPIQPITVKSVLRVCKNRDEYMSYGGPGGSAGYWSDYAEELVIYDDKERQRSDTFRVMYHEGFHQYIFYRCGKIAPHSWYNEGTGDYYSGSVLKYGKFEIHPFQWRTDTARELIHGNKYVPLEKFIRYTQGDYYADGQSNYSQGWSLIWFLREGKKSSKSWKKDWDKILTTYLDTITKTKDKDKAVTAAFDGIDVEELERAWVEFTKGV